MKYIFLISFLIFISCNKETKDYSHWRDTLKLRHELFKKQIEEDIEKQLNNKNND